MICVCGKEMEAKKVNMPIKRGNDTPIVVQTELYECECGKQNISDEERERVLAEFHDAEKRLEVIHKKAEKLVKDLQKGGA